MLAACRSDPPPVARSPSASTAKTPPTPVAKLARLPAFPIEQDRLYLVASKSRHQLYLFRGQRLLRTFNVIFGITDEKEQDKLDKQAAGDNRTPLGAFLIDQAAVVKDPDYGGYWMRLNTAAKARRSYQTRYKKSVVSRWERRWGRIKSDQDVRNFNRWAKLHNEAIMFRGIGIHGGEWQGTYGCIGMTNADVKELYHRLLSSKHGIIGVRVEIYIH